MSLAPYIVAFSFLLAGTAPFARAEEERLPGPIAARVLRVVDGDTVLVRARIWLGQDVETSVRLAGVDTPEKHGDCAAEREAAERAQAFTAARLGEDWVSLRDVINDKYGRRVVARIVVADGSDLSTLLLERGLAHPYGGKRKQSWCP